MAGGISNYLGMKSKFENPVIWARGIIEGYVFIDLAKVTKVSDDRIDCQSGANIYANVEVLILGVNGYGVKLVPDVGDRVLLLAPRAAMNSVEDFDPTFTMNNYDRSGIKAIPLTDSQTPQLMTIDKDGITLEGDNKFTLNKDGITVEDVNENKASLTSDGISVEDANGNKADLTSSGIALEDANSNKVTMSSSGIVMQGQSGKLEIS